MRMFTYYKEYPELNTPSNNLDNFIRTFKASPSLKDDKGGLEFVFNEIRHNKDGSQRTYSTNMVIPKERLTELYLMIGALL